MLVDAAGPRPPCAAFMGCRKAASPCLAIADLNSTVKRKNTTGAIDAFPGGVPDRRRRRAPDPQDHPHGAPPGGVAEDRGSYRWRPPDPGDRRRPLAGRTPGPHRHRGFVPLAAPRRRVRAADRRGHGAPGLPCSAPIGRARKTFSTTRPGTRSGAGWCRSDARLSRSGWRVGRARRAGGRRGPCDGCATIPPAWPQDRGGAPAHRTVLFPCAGGRRGGAAIAALHSA